MKKENNLQIFRDIAREPYAYLRQLKQKSGKVMVGSTCTYTPEEILLAAGLHPFRIFAQSKEFSLADAHLQAYGCSMVRGMLEDGLSGDLDFLDAVVFPHACDSIQRLSDIWRLNVKSLHFDVLLPVKLDSPLSKSYFEKVMSRFKKDVEKAFSVNISNEALDNAILLMNSIREALATLYRLRSQSPGIIAGSDLAAVVKAVMVMDKSEAAEALQQLVSLLKQEPAVATRKKRILISGSVCSHPDIYHIIENKDAVVVWDDLCSGSRYFEGIVEPQSDRIAALAQRFTGRYVCPAKHLGIQFQMENLKSLIHQHQVDAVLFMLLKFCEPFSFDFPDIKNELENMGVRYIMVEMDQHNKIDEQMRTRIDTLLEII